MVLDINNPGAPPANLNTYVSPTPMQRIWPFVDSQGYLYAPNNKTMDTQNGPRIVDQFVLADTTTKAFVNTSGFPNVQNINTGWLWPTAVVTPAPDNYDIQNVANFAGDPFPLRNGLSIGQGTAPTPSQYAQTVADVLGISRASVTNPTRNSTWEQNGYDYDY